MTKIVITLDGGLVQSVLSTEPVEVAVLDYDIEGADESELTDVPQLEPVGPATEQAFASIRDPEVAPEKVASIFAAIG